MRVLGFGTYDVSRHPRVGTILDGLRAHGIAVSEANVRLGFTTAERVEMLGRPWLVYRLALRTLRCWCQLIGRVWRVRMNGGVDAVIVGYLGHFDVLLARLLFPRSTIVLDLLTFAADTARDRGAQGSIKLCLLERLDRLAARAASIIVIDTDEHVSLLGPSQRAKTVVVPVGASTEWYVAADPNHAGDVLTVVFFGLFTPLQGATTIGEAIALLSDREDIRFTMIGSGQEIAAAQSAAATNVRVTWIPWVDPGDLPTVVARHDVCLGIFGTTPKASRVTPNKVFQGAAAGCAIVTSDTPPQRRSLGDAARFVPAGDSVALADILSTLASDVEAIRDLRRRARARAEAAFTPQSVTAPLFQQLVHDHFKLS